MATTFKQRKMLMSGFRQLHGKESQNDLKTILIHNFLEIAIVIN
jgi:hypothetical protein